MPQSEAAKVAQAKYRARQRAERPAAVKRADKLRKRRRRDEVVRLSREIEPDLKNQGQTFLLEDGLNALAPWLAGNDARQAAIIRVLETRPRVKSQAGLKRWLGTTARNLAADAGRKVQALKDGAAGFAEGDTGRRIGQPWVTVEAARKPSINRPITSEDRTLNNAPGRPEGSIPKGHLTEASPLPVKVQILTREDHPISAYPLHALPRSALDHFELSRNERRNGSAAHSRHFYIQANVTRIGDTIQ